MGMVSLPPVCDTNLSQTQRLSFENNNNNNLRQASFSSYLNHAEKEFVRKLAKSTRERSNPTITTTQEEDGDIEVFGAEKYFNGGMDSPKPLKLRPRKQQCKKPEQLQLHPKKPISSRPGTPSVRSESSWNSQNALLQTMLKNPSRAAKPNKSSQAKGFLYKCSCCDKNSVQVDADANTITFNNTHRYGVTNTKINAKQPTRAALNFTFQNSIPPKVAEAQNLPLKMKIQVEDQPKRKSIEVFGSSLLGVGKPNDTVNLEKRLSMLSWKDINPRVKDSNVAATNSNVNYNEDAESDASSDLFEIESLTGNPNSFLTRQGSSDCTDCVTPTTCYAPSEASIEWSVITASAADFPIMSDYDERRLSTTSPVRNISTTTYVIKSNYASNVKDIQRRRSSLLMGCKSQKAVRVAGDSYTTRNAEMIGSEERRAQRSESFGRLTRLEAETKIMSFSSSQRQRQHGLAANSLPRQYSPQISNILYV